MKDLIPTLYEIICQECNENYNFKLYNEDGITESKERPKYDKDKTIILKSHGICKLCLPDVYKKNGLDLEYKLMVENMVELKKWINQIKNVLDGI